MLRMLQQFQLLFAQLEDVSFEISMRGYYVYIGIYRWSFPFRKFEAASIVESYYHNSPTLTDENRIIVEQELRELAEKLNLKR